MGRNVVEKKVKVADSGDVGEMMGRLPQEVVALGNVAQVARTAIRGHFNSKRDILNSLVGGR